MSEDTADPFRFVHVVEHIDVDDSGVMHFSRHHSLVETALLRGLAAVGAGLSALRAAGGDLVVAQSRAWFAAPARHLDRLQVTARLRRLGVYRSHVEGAVALVGAAGPPTGLSRVELVLGVVSSADRRPAPWPDAISRILTTITNDGGAHGEFGQRRGGGRRGDPAAYAEDAGLH
ncbi:acyl-CoA thioesterase [Dactylosporangium sp. CA-233914]|uniref:acyl-CoA thioesterase n=1 Tax=Dactylosporangium sp. CA-233914 TaxID=3239934 RepID=UPI003D8A7390